MCIKSVFTDFSTGNHNIKTIFNELQNYVNHGRKPRQIQHIFSVDIVDICKSECFKIENF